MDGIENKIHELTRVELNHFFKKLWSLFLFLTSIGTIILSFLVGSLVYIWVFFIIVFIVSFIGYLFSHGNADIKIILDFYSFLFFPFIFVSIAYGFILYKKLWEKLSILKVIRDESLQMYKTYVEGKDKSETIDEVLSSLEKIQFGFKKIKRFLWLRFLFSQSGKEKLKNLFLLVTEIAINTIGDLKQSLALGIEQNKRKSQEAIGDLHLTMSENENLQGIKETQIQRLNQQKEEFEKLEKILIRI